MSYALNNVTTQDGYDVARELACPGATRLNVDVNNAAIMLQLGRGWPAAIWGPEVMVTPSFRSLERTCDAVRVRSARAGLPAQVTIAAYTPGDL